MDTLLRLRVALRRQAPASAAGLARSLGISVPTLHRQLQALSPGELLIAGRARRTRYALRRPLRGDGSEWPVYAVDAHGHADVMAPLVLMQPEGSWMRLDDGGWPQPDEARDGWWPGLPYPLLDMRPQGYMGRQFARAEHEILGVSPDPRQWSDDDVLHVLLQRGWDASGNLIIGDTALARWQSSRLSRPPPLSVTEAPAAYARLAEQAVLAGVPGSSAAGEFPKFAARRMAPSAILTDTPHVLVKFSGADESATVQRWADLLVCEHLALVQMQGLPGVVPARSRILRHAGRTFMEVERFDRHGEFGRSPLVTLEALNAALLGMPMSDWSVVAGRLSREGLIDEEGVQAVETLWWFGCLIGNTDMHAGNLRLRPSQARLLLAPAYDMLPMLYAPLAGGELPPREFAPPLPLPRQRAAWHAAFAAARSFWDAAAEDARISPRFRSLCTGAAARLRAVAQHA